MCKYRRNVVWYCIFFVANIVNNAQILCQYLQILKKYCPTQIFRKYFINIVQSYLSNIVQMIQDLCANNVHILCKYCTIYYMNIVEYCSYSVQILNNNCANNVQKWCAYIVEVLCKMLFKYFKNIVQIFCKYYPNI